MYGNFKGNCKVRLDDAFNCSKCTQTYSLSHLKLKESYLVSLDIKSQLVDILDKHHSVLFLEKASSYDGYGDITDGSMYKKCIETSLRYTLTINFSTDGVSLYKSSKSSMWPILCTVNELPLKLRMREIICACIWTGVTKIPMKLLFSDFIDQLKNLELHPIKYFLNGSLVDVHIKAVLCTADAPARAAVQNIKQFNGSFGCCRCENEGSRIGSRHVYATVIKK